MNASSPPLKIRSGPTVTGKVFWSELVRPGDIDIAGGVHGDAEAIIAARAADIAGVEQRRSRRP